MCWEETWSNDATCHEQSIESRKLLSDERGNGLRETGTALSSGTEQTETPLRGIVISISQLLYSVLMDIYALALGSGKWWIILWMLKPRLNAPANRSELSRTGPDCRAMNSQQLLQVFCTLPKSI
ncbi:hypothetical protein KQX54_006753 [Cotesia glomerata]|uniref:Uncharacterized protein n=1 Tax=Cotesia glomerata TaxID=32391 RepID=A0AAV7I2X3_COTGL|nr:hypothetical protein KQX54_006753 [Cotesia glomerata]